MMEFKSVGMIIPFQYVKYVKHHPNDQIIQNIIQNLPGEVFAAASVYEKKSLATLIEIWWILSAVKILIWLQQIPYC